MVVMSLVLFLLIIKYFLVVLIVMELVILNLSMVIFWTLSGRRARVVFLYYLVFRVCERVMGLGVLVLIIRYYGRDFYKVIRVGKI